MNIMEKHKTVSKDEKISVTVARLSSGSIAIRFVNDDGSRAVIHIDEDKHQGTLVHTRIVSSDPKIRDTHDGFILPEDYTEEDDQ